MAVEVFFTYCVCKMDDQVEENVICLCFLGYRARI